MDVKLSTCNALRWLTRIADDICRDYRSILIVEVNWFTDL